jgi:hypothetical protein
VLHRTTLLWVRAGPRQCSLYVASSHLLPGLTAFLVFWEQTGLQTFIQKIQITRPPAAAQPAFERHFTSLLDEYGAVHILNLLGSKENETTLSQAYTQLAARGTNGNALEMTNFDFHSAVRAGGHDSVPLQLK